MIPDPNEEILAIKRRLAARFDNDVRRIAEDTRQRQRESGRRIISLPPRRYKSTDTTNNDAIERSDAGVLHKNDDRLSGME